MQHMDIAGEPFELRDKMEFVPNRDKDIYFVVVEGDYTGCIRKSHGQWWFCPDGVNKGLIASWVMVGIAGHMLSLQGKDL